MTRITALCAAATFVAACSSGGGGTKSAFQVVQFLESGKDDLARNAILNLTFSAPVAQNQDLPTRIKVQNVSVTSTDSNFSVAVGSFLVSGERVTYVPRLPTNTDRTDAGFRVDGDYRIFLSAGPDAVVSTAGDAVIKPQEFAFATASHFEDFDPSSPPRAMSVGAIDTASQQSFDLSRIGIDATAETQVTDAELLEAEKAIEPGAGGPPNFETPWHFDVMVSEPLDPATVTVDNIELRQVAENVFDDNNQIPPGHENTPLIPGFKVPVRCELFQQVTPEGALDTRIRVTPLHTLVDDARYRLSIGGNILGLDFRRVFIGDNGLTGETMQGSATVPQDGGLGYVTDFLVLDRPSITTTRTLLYNTILDGIEAEDGTSIDDENLINSSLYDSATPPGQPGRAVGFLGAFGDGSDGDFSVSGVAPVILDTGDTPNVTMSTFSVFDADPDNEYSNNGLPQQGQVTHDNPTPTEFQFSSMTVTGTGTLRVIGVNPVRFRVSGLVTINGTVDVAGQSPATTDSSGGAGGAGGFKGGDSRQGLTTCQPATGTCTSFDQYLNAGGCQNAANGFPFSEKGEGPGRGMEGGEFYTVDSVNNMTGSRAVGTGGGGAGHATPGQDGEDRANASGTLGTAGPACSQSFRIANSGVIGVRSVGGDSFGDRELLNVFMGGGGGGGGGSVHSRPTFGTPGAGGPGGGGGGAIEILSAGGISIIGGRVDASGGDGHQGRVINMRNNNQFNHPTGGGGGGAGGSISLVSGAEIQVLGGTITAAGGSGGARAHVGTTLSCSTCNAGGDGGKGFIFLMDSDGEIAGLPNGTVGDHDIAEGILTVRAFALSRFGDINATTRPFSAQVANPAYQPLSPAHISAVVDFGQTITLFVSSARADLDDPTTADIGTEGEPFPVAEITRDGNLVKIDTSVGDMGDLNSAGIPARDEYVRVRAQFDYANPVQAALGPFAAIDRVVLTYEFN
ncbi:MAG: hypothetical protein V3T86_04505 [Planctomycetota bacterium]